MLGHDAPPTNFWTENLLTGAPLERCPVRAIQLARERGDPIAAEIDRYCDDYYEEHQSGHLLVKGGVSDQPARYLTIIGMIRDMESKIETKLVEILKLKGSES